MERRLHRALGLAASGIANNNSRRLSGADHRATRSSLSAIAAVPPNPNCVIKGNMGARDGCIYHMPGGRFYDQLKMEPSAARRWFCGEAEAQAAGCRKSKL